MGLFVGLLLTATAYGAGSWLLMVPPATERPPSSIAIARWRQHQAFDTAAACERIRRRETDTAWAALSGDEKTLTVDQLDLLDEVNDTSWSRLSARAREAAAWRLSRCVPASVVPVR
jgi:hypothetical protein